jgi:hypothetical protein
VSFLSTSPDYVFIHQDFDSGRKTPAEYIIIIIIIIIIIHRHCSHRKQYDKNFNVCISVRQDDALLVVLFNLVLDCVINSLDKTENI